MDLFNDPEFEKYRVKEIEEGVHFLSDIVQNRESMEYFRGSMAMLKRIINLPISMIPPENKSQQEQAKVLKSKAFDLFEAKMIRKFVQEDE